jgi:secreted PhoX family phosphatase
MRSLGRRQFMITSSAVTISLSFATLARNRHAVANEQVGELVQDPNGILDLPEGFTYHILETAGDDMDDGYRVPARPDGMACFAGPNNTLILMRNHEISINGGGGPYKDGQDPVAEAYDEDGMGGVTRVVIDADTFERISSNLVLIGTARNCCGGPSPWGWLSCEENLDVNKGVKHGYVFLCPTDAETVQPAQRIPGYGRFNHEAVCIDPSTNYAYLTEDRGDGCLYRFVPDAMNDPFVGKLQALQIVGESAYDTNDMTENDVFAVAWVDIDEADPDDDSVREEGHDKGAAVIVRGEGIWFFEGQIYIASTSGGPNGTGMIFRLIDGESPTLELIVRSTDETVLEKPDNITVAPWGEVFTVENGDPDNYIRWISETGDVGNFACNAYTDSEMCGICFSPDGRAMFVNLQNDGLTLVITGPFPMVVPAPGSSTGDGDGDGDGDSGDGDSGDGGSGDGGSAEGGPGDDDGDGTTGNGDGGSDDGTSGTEGWTSGDPGAHEGEASNCSTNGSDKPGLAFTVTAAAALGLQKLLTTIKGKPTLGD